VLAGHPVFFEQYNINTGHVPNKTLQSL